MNASHKPLAEEISDLVKAALEALEVANEDDLAASLPRVLETAADEIFKAVIDVCREQARELRQEDAEFAATNDRRWSDGFGLLRLHRRYCIEAGQIFQEQFLQHEEYLGDPLVGALMRLHAHGCRAQGEIIALLEAGYPDGAFARWRTLHEYSVTAFLLREGGRKVAEDYVWYGLFQGAVGMLGYQDTAKAMGREPYSAEEISQAEALRAKILGHFGGDFLSRNGWARKHFDKAKFEKLQEAAGLGHWRNDYAAASRNVHGDFREMHALLALPQGHEPVLVCGPSDSGMVEPAHSAAISLTQLTIAFIFADMNREDCPLDFTASIVLARLLGRLSTEVGRVFLELHEAH